MESRDDGFRGGGSSHGGSSHGGGGRRRPMNRMVRVRNTARFQIPPETHIDYKNVNFLQRYINDRGKILGRRLSGINAKEQRKLCMAIQRARFLALLPTGGVRK